MLRISIEFYLHLRIPLCLASTCSAFEQILLRIVAKGV